MSPRTIRWGILATGRIAESFTKDLLVDPVTRNVTNIQHTVVAAASSSSKDRAQEFLKTVGAPLSAKAYGSYQEFSKDSDIDIVYVATPHSHHYQNVMLCLEAGKNVLCEKAFTTNAAQLKILVQKAKEKVRRLILSASITSIDIIWTESLLDGSSLDSVFPLVDICARCNHFWTSWCRQ